MTVQKQKFKVNILDVAIFIVIICCVAVLIFRDTINEFFGEPEITHISVTVSFDGTLPAEQAEASEGTNVVFKPIRSDELKLDARIRRPVTVNSSANPATSQMTITCKGYKKLGRFYTESGELIALGSECSLSFSGSEAYGRVTKVELSNT